MFDITLTSLGSISFLGISTIHQTGIPDLIANLAPTSSWAQSRNWPDPAEDVIHQRRHNEAGEEVKAIYIVSSDGNRGSNGTSKANNIYHDTTEVGSPASPLNSVEAVIWAVSLGVVEITDLEVALADEIVIADHRSRNTR